MSHSVLLVLIAASLALVAAYAHAAANLRTLRAQLRQAQETQHATESHRTHLDTVKNEFVANVSHELRTPLTSIRGALGLLSSGLFAPAILKDDPRAQSLLHIALSNTDRLIRLINDLLDLDRISSGQAPLTLRRCSARELAQAAIETMTPQADAARVRLHLVLEAPPDCMFFDADPDRILQILTNLLSNAIKFSPPSSIVEIRIEAQPDTLRLRVSDSGRGIPSHKLTSIFGRFEQVEPADAREKGGTGLGLAICRTIMQQHGGAIWAESNPDREPGARFFITFPRSARQQDTRSSQSDAARQGTILLCDADPALRTLVAQTIHRHGYRVLEAPTVDCALSLAAAQPVDAVLVELALPGCEGTAPIDWLRRQPATASLPLLVYSMPKPSVTPHLGTSPHTAQPSKLDAHPPHAAPPDTLSPSEVGNASTPSTPEVNPREIEDLVLGIVNRLRSSQPIAAA